MSDINAVQPGAPIVSTSYGTVYPNRITFFGKKGWFSGGVQEDLPIRHVTSVRLETKRNIIGGLILAFIGIVFLFAKGPGILFALIAFGLAFLAFWGSVFVQVNNAGGQSRPARGAPWTKDEAEKYVSAVRSALFEHNA